jgi:hypothetical protein
VGGRFWIAERRDPDGFSVRIRFGKVCCDFIVLLLTLVDLIQYQSSTFNKYIHPPSNGTISHYNATALHLSLTSERIDWLWKVVICGLVTIGLFLLDIYMWVKDIQALTNAWHKSHEPATPDSAHGALERLLEEDFRAVSSQPSGDYYIRANDENTGLVAVPSIPLEDLPTRG